MTSRTPLSLSGAVAFITALVVIATLFSSVSATARTPPFTDDGGAPLPMSIASMERWQVNGSQEEVWVRGRDRRNPVLVLLHGGPGTSESALFRHYLPELEHDFTVVYWDQPGTGRSYTDDVLRRPLTIDRVLQDLDVVVDTAMARFQVSSVALLGHSWGTALGVMYCAAHPEKVSVYVGTGQVASVPEGERLSYRFAAQAARERNNEKALHELQEIGPPPHTVSEMLVSRKWVERFGGTFGKSGLSTRSLIFAALSQPETTLLDLYRFGAGNRRSLDAIWPEYARLDLTGRYKSLDVPVYFILGALDWVTPASLAEDYFRSLRAPCKTLITVPDAAHNVPFEKPQEFLRALRGPVLDTAKEAGRPQHHVCADHQPHRKSGGL